MRMFDDDAEYEAFAEILGQAYQRVKIPVLGYCLMPSHWHLVLWPRRDGDLSKFMHWLTATHTRRWHVARRAIGHGALYQGRFKSFPIETDEHLLTVLRYVERNPLRAKLVDRSQDWRWSSVRGRKMDLEWLVDLKDWPVEAPGRWLDYVNRPQTDKEVEELRRSVRRGTPYGNESWQRRVAGQLGLESSLRDPWRPKKTASAKPKTAGKAG